MKSTESAKAMFSGTSSKWRGVFFINDNRELQQTVSPHPQANHPFEIAWNVRLDQ